MIFLQDAPARYQPNARVDENVKEKRKFFHKLARRKKASERCSLSVRALNYEFFFSETNVHDKTVLGVSRVISGWDPARLKESHSGKLRE